MGPAGGGAHADREWVEVSSLESLASILMGLALDYCG
jgi:di/tripeptidase